MKVVVVDDDGDDAVVAVAGVCRHRGVAAVSSMCCRLARSDGNRTGEGRGREWWRPPDRRLPIADQPPGLRPILTARPPAITRMKKPE